MGEPVSGLRRQKKTSQERLGRSPTKHLRGGEKEQGTVGHILLRKQGTVPTVYRICMSLISPTSGNSHLQLQIQFQEDKYHLENLSFLQEGSLMFNVNIRKGDRASQGLGLDWVSLSLSFVYLSVN